MEDPKDRMQAEQGEEEPDQTLEDLDVGEDADKIKGGVLAGPGDEGPEFSLNVVRRPG
jgi:hypothetical protein